MGSQTPSSNDRSRTYWTPTMERYFIDLMLEHMHRGNRIGHTFNKQAWTDMLAVFNAKFGSQYDKDVLKGRYTNLWKQFNDVKNLLGQTGFCWDENREIVVAEDHVWAAHIKAHPDARTYKTKSVLNFNDLCLIYGYTTADGRYSRSSHDIDIDDEAQGLNSGMGIGSQATPNSEHSRTDWTTPMDEYFIELLLDQQARGNKLDNTFNKQAWTEILTLFNARYGSQHNKRVLRHRYKKLSKYYTDITVLLKQNGFSWDETQHIVAASDDVWDAYIKARPHARSYRTKVMPNYKDLGLIFQDATNDGIRSDLSQNNDLEDDALGTKTGSERSRTYWTPPMDRYLIDLLLDQVHRGNRIGQTFVTQAWVDMFASFNKKFKSLHDKDVLKNRHKHLKRQYNDIKILLEQRGFSWDEKREMVTAKDQVWDAYIKAHPDARSYRVKTLPSYHKLRIIYGQDNYDGRYGRLARNLDQDGEIPLLLTEGWTDDQSPTSRDLMTDWTPPMERHFIDLMLELVNQRSNTDIDRALNEQAWLHMIESFNGKFGLQCDKYMLESQYICLMKQHIDIGSLLNQNGFAWDEARQIIVADDDAWEAHIKDHPDAVLYRGKILGHYKDLCVIFGGRTINGQLSCQDFEMGIDYNSLDTVVDEFLPEPVTDIDTFDQKKKRSTEAPSTPGRSRKVRKTNKEETQETFLDKKGPRAKLVIKKAEKTCTSIESAIDALQAIPDIDDELLLDACDLLEDERKAKTFLALDATLRKKWLLRKLDRQCT